MKINLINISSQIRCNFIKCKQILKMNFKLKITNLYYMTILLTVSPLTTILISIILISVALNVFQFIQLHYMRIERNQYFNIIINTKFTNEEPERKQIGFQQFAELGNREDEPEDKLRNSRFTLPFWSLRFPRNKGPVRNLHRGRFRGFW